MCNILALSHCFAPVETNSVFINMFSFLILLKYKYVKPTLFFITSATSE